MSNTLNAKLAELGVALGSNYELGFASVNILDAALAHYAEHLANGALELQLLGPHTHAITALRVRAQATRDLRDILQAAHTIIGHGMGE